MEHIAIDLGRRESQICVRNDSGEILHEARHATSELRSYLRGRPRGSRVLVESSAEAFTVADWATELGHEPRVVPSILVPALGVGERGLKNDVRDARKLSEMDCRMPVPSVHIPLLYRILHSGHERIFFSFRFVATFSLRRFYRKGLYINVSRFAPNGVM